MPVIYLTEKYSEFIKGEDLDANEETEIRNQIGAIGNPITGTIRLEQEDDPTQYIELKSEGGPPAATRLTCVGEDTSLYIECLDPTESVGTSNNIYFRVNTVDSPIAVMRINGSTRNVAIGSTAGLNAKLQIVDTGEQFRVGYSSSNYFNAVVGSTGTVTFDAAGDDAGFFFSKKVTIGEDIEITDDTKGLILESPDGSRFRIQVDDSGELMTTEI